MITVLLFLRAYIYLLYFHSFIRWDKDGGRFHRLHRAVSKSPLRRANGTTQDQVITAVNYAIALLPVKTRCLQRAAATVKLLREQGIAAQMIIGAKVFPFAGHAWVEVSGRAINEPLDTQATYGVLERC